MGENNIIPLHVFTINMYLIISIKNFFFFLILEVWEVVLKDM
jgi:hypothetical protein